MTDETKKDKKEDGEVSELSEEELENVSGGGATHKDSWKGESVRKYTVGGSGGEDR